MLEELQSLSDGNKKRILIIATMIIMIIIIGMWVVYFNGVIMGTAEQVATDATTTSAGAVAPTLPTVVAPSAPAQANGPSLWQNIENGFGSIANVFKKPSHYNIQPQ